MTVISPRSGARQTSHAVVVKVKVRNFQLSPRHFGGEPQLARGPHPLRPQPRPRLRRPGQAAAGDRQPLRQRPPRRRSFDFPEYSGPNGVLAERIGSAGSYSPATRPEIYYHALPPGFYRLVITLAQNDGSTTPFHAVTNFQILPKPGHGPKCTGGKVPSAKAAAFD